MSEYGLSPIASARKVADKLLKDKLQSAYEQLATEELKRGWPAAMNRLDKLNDTAAKAELHHDVAGPGTSPFELNGGMLCDPTSPEMQEKIKAAVEKARANIQAHELAIKQAPRNNFITQAMDCGFTKPQAEFLWMQKRGF